MDRIQILQRIIIDNNFKSYLEIGTFRGDSFLPLKCKTKIAVDPDFQISIRKKIRWIYRNHCNIFNSYFEMSSDEFFNKKSKWFNNKGKIDLVFIDGLHTFRASLSDVLNSLKNLNPLGTIVLHDCLPPNRAASTPANSIDHAEEMQINGWTKEWCGDVWKTIYYLREIYPEELEVFTLNCDYGLGIIKIKNPDLNLKINEKVFKDILNIDYSYLEQNTKELLNLKSEETFNKFR